MVRQKPAVGNTRTAGREPAHPPCRLRLPDTRTGLLLTVVCFFIAGGCQRQASTKRDVPDRHAQIFDSPAIDAMLAAAPQTLIYLDDVPVPVWTPDMELGRPRDSLVLGGSFMFDIARDSLYFANFRDAVYVSDLGGVLQRQIGRTGKGPGEFDLLSDFGFSGTYFFTGEASRIQVLSSDFAYVATLPPQTSKLIPGTGLAVTESRIYTSCERGHDYRVCPRSAFPPFREEAPFLSSLGISNPSMDGIAFGATPDGKHVLVAFWGLPYLLVFGEDHEHVHTLRLVGDPVEAHADNYTMNQPGVPGTGLRIFILRIHILDNEFVAVPIRDVWHFIRIGSDGTFEHAGAARLMKSGASEAYAIVAMSQARLHDGHLYVYANDVPHLLRFPFPY